MGLQVTYYNDIQWRDNLLTLLAADPPASHPEWVPPCLLSCFPQLCWVPTDFFPKTGWAWPCVCPLPQTSSRELWIQAPAPFSVGHTLVYVTPLSQTFPLRDTLPPFQACFFGQYADFSLSCFFKENLYLFDTGFFYFDTMSAV